jgi:hypothetical protein
MHFPEPDNSPTRFLHDAKEQHLQNGPSRSESSGEHSTATNTDLQVPTSSPFTGPFFNRSENMFIDVLHSTSIHLNVV